MAGASKGFEGEGSESPFWDLSAALYAGKARTSSSLLLASSSDLKSSEKLLAGVERMDEVRDEWGEERRSSKLEKEQLFLRREKGAWWESKKEVWEVDGRSGACLDSISTGAGMRSVIVGGCAGSMACGGWAVYLSDQGQSLPPHMACRRARHACAGGEGRYVRAKGRGGRREEQSAGAGVLLWALSEWERGRGVGAEARGATATRDETVWEKGVAWSDVGMRLGLSDAMVVCALATAEAFWAW